MDRQTRFYDQYTWTKGLIDKSLAMTFTSMPGVVETNHNDGTAAVRLGIYFRSKDQNGNWQDIKPATLIPKALIVFPGDDNFMFTTPVKAGTTGLVVFCDRCIDAFWQSGGSQPQMDRRMHDLTDGVFIPGLKITPNYPTDINQNSAELRTKTGNTKITFDDTGGVIIKATTVKIDGDLQITGSVTSGQGGVDQVNLQTHKHSGGPPPDPGT